MLFSQRLKRAPRNTSNDTGLADTLNTAAGFSSSALGPAVRGGLLEMKSLTSPKMQLYGLSALVISDVWKDVERWRTDHANVYGLGYTSESLIASNLLRKKGGPIEECFPILQPLDQDELRDVRSVCYSDPKRACQMIAGFTRLVLGGHLLKWEQKATSGEDEEREALHRAFCGWLDTHRPEVLEHTLPVARSLVNGFTFGQSVIWQLMEVAPDVIELQLEEKVTPETLLELALAARPLVNELARTHLLVVEELSQKIGSGADHMHPLAFDCSRESGRLQWTIAKHVVHQMTGSMKDSLAEKFPADPAFSEETPGCPALYTSAISSLHEWIVELAAEFSFKHYPLQYPAY